MEGEGGGGKEGEGERGGRGKGRKGEGQRKGREGKREGRGRTPTAFWTNRTLGLNYPSDGRLNARGV